MGSQQIIQEILDELISCVLNSVPISPESLSSFSLSLSPMSMSGPEDDSILGGLINSSTSSENNTNSDSYNDLEIETSSDLGSGMENDSGNDSCLMNSWGNNGSYVDTPLARTNPEGQPSGAPRRLFDPSKPDTYGGFDL